MAGQLDEEPTIIDAYPREVAQGMVPPVSSRTTERHAASLVRTPSVAVDGRDSDPSLDRAGENGAKLAEVGAEDHFILA